MKIIFTTTLSFLFITTFAQWPNSVDKRLTIRQTKNYQIISKNEIDNAGNTFLVMKEAIFVSKSSPWDTYFVWNYFQKLDKQGIPQWNLDSTKILCNEYKTISDNDGGLYVFYYKSDMEKPVDYHSWVFQINCLHINKNGTKVWDTVLEKFVSYLNSETMSILTVDLDINQQPTIYLLRNGILSIQKVDKNGQKLADKTFGQKPQNFSSIYTYSLNKSKTFLQFYNQNDNNGRYQNTIFSKKDENWNELWKKEIVLTNNEIFLFTDDSENILLMQNVIENYPNYHQILSKIAPNGEVTFSNKRLSDKPNLGFKRYNYYFDSQNSLNLYLISENGSDAKIDYFKISPIGDIVSNKELTTLSSRASESKKIISSFFENNYELSFTRQGDLLMSWTKQGKDLQELYISKFDSEGIMLWKEDKLIDKDSTIFSVKSSAIVDSKITSFYNSGRFPFSIPIHTTNFYAKRLSENGNFNELKAEISNKICQNDEIAIKILPEGSYEKDNQYKVLLSDTKGNFSNPTQLITSNQTDFKIAKIANLTEGDYKVKVISSNPIVEIANPIDLKVSKIPTLVLTQSEKVLRNDSTLIKFDMIGALPFKLKLWDDKEYTVSSNTFERYLKPIQSGEYAIKSFSDANCFAGSLNFKITLIEPLSTETNNDFVKIYPNYQTQQLELFIPENVNNDFYISMYSVKGEVLFEKSEKVERIDLKQLNQGIYLLKGVFNGKTFTKKFLLEKY